jgi:hypothetical protein
MKIRRYDGTNWVQEYPEVDVNAIVATGTPSSTTFLRGDGAWAVPADVDNYLPLSGGTMTSDIKFTNATDIGIENASGNSWYRPEDQYGNSHIEVRSGKGLYVDADTIALRSQTNTDRLRITSAGDVGIGTTAPAQKLEVNGITRIWQSGQSALKTYSGQAGLQLVGYQSDSGSPYLKTSDIVANADGTVASQMRLFTKASGDSSATERVRIESDGKVGIGTTSPSSKLTIAQTGSGTNNSLIVKDAARQVVIGRDSVKAQDLNGNAATLYLNQPGGNTILSSQSGNVGVGIASPAEKLDVNGSIQANGNFKFKGSGGYYIYNSSGTFRGGIIDDGGATKIYGDGNGSTPVITLDSGNASFGNDVTITGDLTVSGTTTTMNTTVSTTDQWTVTNSGTDVATIINQTGTADILDVRDNGTSVFKVKDGGDVELKTDSKLTVGASTTANEAKIILDASNGGHPQIGLAENNDASWALGVDDGDNSFKIHGAASSSIPSIGGLSTPHFELDTTGNMWLQKRLYLTSNAFIEYNSTNDSIDFFFN